MCLEESGAQSRQSEASTSCLRAATDEGTDEAMKAEMKRVLMQRRQGRRCSRPIGCDINECDANGCDANECDANGCDANGCVLL